MKKCGITHLPEVGNGKLGRRIHIRGFVIVIHTSHINLHALHYIPTVGVSQNVSDNIKSIFTVKCHRIIALFFIFDIFKMVRDVLNPVCNRSS